MKKYDYRYWILPGVFIILSIIFIIYSKVTGNLQNWIDVAICYLIIYPLYIIYDIREQKEYIEKAETKKDESIKKE